MATKMYRGVIQDDYLALIKRFPLTPIKSDAQLAAAFTMVDELAIISERDLTKGQSDYLAVLTDIVSKYEDKDANNSVSGLDLLKHLLEANDMNGSDLGTLLGNRSLGAKILSGTREISKANADVLGKRFGLPREMFLRT